MIQVTVRFYDHYATIHFPCSEVNLLSALMETHAADITPNELLVTDVDYPKELGFIKNRFINLDELNFLAKRMVSFWGLEETQFYEAMKLEGFTDLKDLINLTFNLNRYTLIQNVGNMTEIGRTYKLNTEGSIPAGDKENPEYAELGRKLVASGEGVFTENGLLFVNKEKPFEELYDGQVFPPYLYDNNLRLIGILDYGGKKEYVYLPCEALAIHKALKRLGVENAENMEITLEDFNIHNSEWLARIKERCEEEGIYEVNKLVGALNRADMDLEKLSAIVRYAAVKKIEDIIKLAENMGRFIYVPGAINSESVGKGFVSMNPEYQIPPDLERYFDFEKYGAAILESHEGVFLEDGGYVCMEDGRNPEEFLGIDESIKMGGIS